MSSLNTGCDSDYNDDYDYDYSHSHNYDYSHSHNLDYDYARHCCSGTGAFLDCLEVFTCSRTSGSTLEMCVAPLLSHGKYLNFCESTFSSNLESAGLSAITLRRVTRSYVVQSYKAPEVRPNQQTNRREARSDGEIPRYHSWASTSISASELWWNYNILRLRRFFSLWWASSVGEATVDTGKTGRMYQVFQTQHATDHSPHSEC